MTAAPLATKPAGTCKHRPISNGWSQQWTFGLGWRPSHSWCGRCKAVVDHDEQWLAKWAERGQRFQEVGSDPLGRVVRGGAA